MGRRLGGVNISLPRNGSSRTYFDELDEVGIDGNGRLTSVVNTDVG